MRRKLTELLKNMFVQGVSPSKLALTISLGVFIGTMPLLWGSTLICAVVAVVFRLNQPAIQAANYVVYPVQLALIIPFYRMGAGIFPWGPSVSLDTFSKWTLSEWMGNIVPFADATFKALAAWFIIASPLAVLLYFLLWIIFIRLPKF
jgi:uncharacterized protein (DUF2062 family)